MTFLPKRLKRPKMNLRESKVIRCPSHLQWVRGHMCAVGDFECEGKIEAAHVRVGTDGGVGMKPGDNFTIPLCSAHHRDQHQIGERSFEKETGIVMLDIAKRLWDISPHGQRYRREHP